MSPKFSFINNTWDIAVQHGHSAFKLLQLGYDDESGLDKIENDLKIIPEDSTEYLKKINDKKNTYKNMYRMYSTSVIMFQSMMEAIINDVLEKISEDGYDEKFKSTLISDLKPRAISLKKSNDFGKKWTSTLKGLSKSENEFNEYSRIIYKPLRNLFIHPDKGRLKELDNLQFSFLYKGFKNGWEAYNLLYAGLGCPLDDDSWEIMCGIYEISKNKNM